MERVLISFLGTGKKAQGEGKQEYEKANYQLPDGNLQESSLITSVLYKYLQPDRLIVIGTPESIWSELSKIDPENLGKGALYEKIFEITWNQKMTLEMLKEWEHFLNKNLSADIKLYLLDSNDTEAEKIFEFLNEGIPENTEEVYLDITHAFRHFPIVAAFSLPVLKYLKNFKTLKLTYGKLKKFPNPSPVIFMKIPTHLMELLEAISLAENTGNFEKFAEILKEPKIKELYLRTETNRKISNQQFKKLAKKLSPKKENIIQEISVNYLTEKVFKEIKGESLAIRMAKRALFFAKRNQFLKAYTLIYEALINTQTGINGKNNFEIYRKKKEMLENSLNPEQKKIYEIIKNLRHTIAHGSDPQDYSLQQILNSEKELREWVLKGYQLIEEILKNL